MKPAYVSVEFWRKDRDDTVIIEGWMTNEDTEHLFVSPSIDYDVEVMKFAIPNDKVISITPAQSVREYDATHSPRAIIMHQPLPKNWREEMIFNLQKEIDRNDG